MKRFLLVVLSISLAVAGFSQGSSRELNFKLTEIRADGDVEFEQFSYNDDMLLQAVYTRTFTGEQLIDSLWYDVSNNIVKINFYQLIGNEWKYVSYIDYTYDENGNRLTRSNYNSFGTDIFTLGGVYNYFYNADNQQTHWEMYLGGTELWQLCTLTYNDDGQLVQEIGQDSFYSGVMEDSWKVDYQYNPDGTLNNTFQSYWSGNSWEVSATRLFTYDEYMNCTKMDYKIGGTLLDRKEYEYNMEVTSDQIFMPVHAEAQTRDLIEMNNMATLYHWYAMNDAGSFVYVCDFNFGYDTLTYTGNNNYACDAVDLRMYPNPTSNVVTITGNNTVINDIAVMDNAGKLVLENSQLNRSETQLDVTTLKSGVYYIRLATSKGVAIEKLIIQ